MPLAGALAGPCREGEGGGRGGGFRESGGGGGGGLTFMVLGIWWVPLLDGRNSHLEVSPSLPSSAMASGIDTFLKLGWKMVRLTNCCFR